VRGARAVAIAILAVSTTAAADVSPDDAAKAAELFKQAQAILDAHPTDAAQIEAACDKFDASLRLDREVGTLLNLANCRERQGRVVAAYDLYVAAADLALQTAKPGRAAFARERVTALGSKLGHVALHVADPTTPGIAIRIGTRSLAAGEWAKTQIVEPGTISIEVTAPAHKSIVIERAVAAGSDTVVDIPALEPIAAAPVPVPALAPAPQPVPEAAAPTHRAFYVGGAGVALLATSAVLGLHAKSRYDDAAAAFDTSRVSSAQHEADVATVFAIAGAVAGAVGGWLYFHDREARHQVVVSPTAIGTGTGVIAVGRF
jgi:hypothetical protein